VQKAHRLTTKITTPVIKTMTANAISKTCTEFDAAITIVITVPVQRISSADHPIKEDNFQLFQLYYLRQGTPHHIRRKVLQMVPSH
jgi:hypothetical protein